MGKSSKHKTQNTHHFISFADRISNVTIDVIHHIRHTDDEIEETHFSEALEKWTELDLTDHFSNFRREISGQVQTFEQLVHHKDEILQALKTHLAVPNSLALNALLDCLVQLARDLQQDFVPHFQEFFTLLVQILTSNSQDAEAVEQTFQALAHLFKILWRFLIKDLNSVFSYFSDLLASSQKDYIKVFAAESCAYLMRKVKKQNELISFLFGSLRKSPELAEGIGLLLFEMVKGVKYHFHTIVETVFPIILHSLGPWTPVGMQKSALPQQLVEKSVTVFMQECAEHTTKENCGALWDILLHCVSQIHVACLGKEGKEKRWIELIKHFCRLLRLISLWLLHGNGIIVTNPASVAFTLNTILKSPCAPVTTGPDLVDTIANLQKICHERIPADVIHSINSLVFSSAIPLTNLNTYLKVLWDLPHFEQDILPQYMQRLHLEFPVLSEEQRDDVVSLVVQLVMHKTRVPMTGEELNMLQIYPLDRSWCKLAEDHSLTLYIDSVILNIQSSDKLSAAAASVLWAAVICLPHLSVNLCQEKAGALWKALIHKMKHNSVSEDAMLSILNQLFQSLLTIALVQKTKTLPFEYREVYDILRWQPSSPLALHILDLYLSCPQVTSLLTESCFSDIYVLLQPNLVSPSHTVRLLACHTLSLFPVRLPDVDDGIVRKSAFKIMHEAEQLVPTVHNYREKLIYLRKLEHPQIIRCLPSEKLCEAPLLFLLGNMFWNFKLLWEPLCDIISSHAFGQNAQEFWNVMLSQLQKAAKKSEQELQESMASSDSSELSTLSSLFSHFQSHLLKDSQIPNFTNYRVQLWRAMKKFPEKCILKSDELCSLFVTFLQNEFSSADEDSQLYQDILNENAMNTARNTVEVTENISGTEHVAEIEQDVLDENPDMEEVDDDIMDTSAVSEPGGKEKAKQRKRAAVKSLLAHLELFSLFKKHRSMFNQPEVQETLYDLLKHRDGSVQKAAFDCILTYKSPHILPYRDNFLRLLDDNTFKSEIVLFRVDEESSEIKESDRKGLLPILMRILYGKLQGKAGKETSGKARSNLRRSIVFGFLCGCKQEELKYFLELLLQPCMQFVTGDVVSMVRQVQLGVNLKKMTPLKRIKGILNTVNAVLKKMGHQLGEFAHTLLAILLGITATLNAALAQRQMLLTGVIRLLKTLRHTVMIRLNQFFQLFEEYDFTADEIEATFQAAVWPQAEKLVLEGVHQPTPLLKLFLFWSSSRRFLPLLGHAKEGGDLAVTPLSCVFSLLDAPSVSSSTTSSILDLVNNLLQPEEEEDLSQKVLPLPGPFDLQQGNKQGPLLLLPHMPSLLHYLQSSLGKVTNTSLGKKRQVPGLDIKILSRVSNFVQSPEDCQTLCKLLVPFFAIGNSLPQDVEENTLQSVINLMQHVEKPEEFYRTVSQLFVTIERRESHSLLCTLFKEVCGKDTMLLKLSYLIEKLNAWDKKKAEEPDYMRRLEAFSQINSMILETQPSVNLFLPVIYNCFHFIHTVDDLSIRDNSTHCLINIVNRLTSSPEAEDNKVFNIVLEQALLPQVKQGLKHKLEAVRNEVLAVLHSLVTKCPTHQMFTGLIQLCDKDPEADFFENIRHIQIHKRSRALRRLYRHLKDHGFRSEIHLSYFIPLVNAFVLDPSYSQHANIQDAAIDLLGAICKQLQWPHYLNLVKFYLKMLPKKMELQRQIVRIIVALLDAFHFDLRKSSFSLRLAPNVMNRTYNEHKVGDAENESGPSVTGDEQSDRERENNNFVAVGMQVEDEYDTRTEDDNAEQMASTDGKVLCSVAAATRIHKTIVISLLPQLHKILTQRARSDQEHKLVKSKHPEDEEILRVPIALAMIKLLQNLPKQTLENQLPGVLLKICYFLRSRSRDIRTTARETMEKVVLSLGPRFFPFILKEMKSVLTRGYQLHVLSFTTHHLLKSLQAAVNPGDLDPSISCIQEIFHAELFGQVAEEKEVEAIRAKFFEAKFIKGYDAYEILARCISSRCLNQLLQPVKTILESTQSQSTATKAETVLRKMADGLIANKSIPIETMMIFIHSLTSSLAPYSQEKGSMTSTENAQQPDKPLMPESCLLLPQAIPRGGIKPKSSKKTNVHLLLEFGLQLLSMCLKNSSLEPTDHSHLEMLDPIIPVISHCLSDSHVKSSANAMRCLSWLLRFPLPSLKENIDRIAQGMFVVLQNYTGAATAKGGNQELISMCFKAVTVLIRDVTYYQITKDQLQVLLTYCEEDLYNYSRQSSAFNLIRAILSRKLDIPQLHQVMEKLFEMSVSNSSPSVRLQSRQVILQYLMNYPLGRNLKKHLYFYIDQLGNDIEEGRLSVLEMMMSMFSAFPQKILNNHCPKFFVALAMASFNDPSMKCRKLVLAALKTLLGKIDVKRKKTLFADVIKWMKSVDLRVCAMGCHICGIFVEVEGVKFELYVMQVFPILQELIYPDKYANNDGELEQAEQQDTCLLAVINTTKKIVRDLSIMKQARFTSSLNQIWNHLLKVLMYPHTQVRLASCQLVGLLFRMWEPVEIAEQQKDSNNEIKEESPYILTDTLEKMQKFAATMCQLIQSPVLDDNLAEQVMKNLLYIARVTEALDNASALLWLTRRVMKEANMEVINNVKVSIKRNHVFKWIAAVSVSLKPESVQLVLPCVLPALQREISEQAQDQELKDLAQQVIELLKKQVTVETFTTAFANSQKRRLEKRELRKRQSAAETIINPELAAKRKIRHNLKKKETRKRKFEEKMPIKRVKKNKLSILNINVGDD